MDPSGSRSPRPGWSNLVPRVTLPASMEPSRPSESPPPESPQAARRLPEIATEPMIAAIRVIERDTVFSLCERQGSCYRVSEKESCPRSLWHGQTVGYQRSLPDPSPRQFLRPP